MRKTIAVLGVVAWLRVMPGSLARAEDTPAPVPDEERQRAESAFARGEKLVASGDVEGALRSWRESLPLYQQAGDRVGEGWASFRVGVAVGCEQGLPFLKRAVPLLRDARHAWEGEATYFLGYCQERVEGDSYLEPYQRAIPLLEASGKRRLQALALMRVGMALDDLGRTGEALEALRQAAPLLHAENQGLLEATTYTTLALVHVRAYEYAPAREYLLKALPLFQASDHPLQEAEVYRHLAAIADAQGQFREALVHQQRALALFEQAHESGGKARVEHELGLFYYWLQRYPLALQYFQRSYDSWADAGRQAVRVEPPGQGKDLGPEMDQQYRQDLRETHPTEQARNLRMMGMVYERQGKWKEARESYERALPLVRGSKEDEASLQAQLGTMWVQLKDSTRALEAYEQALTVFQEKGDLWEQANTLSSMARLHAGQGEVQTATQLGERVQALLGEMKQPDLRALVMKRLSSLHRQLGDPARALAQDKQALAIIEQLGERDLVSDILDSVGWDHELLGEGDKALEFYERAIAVGESRRAEASAEEVKTYLSSDLADTYTRATRLLLKRGDVVTAFELNERGRARALLDMLGNARPHLGAGAADELVRRHQELSRELTRLNTQLSELSSRTLDAGEQDTKSALEDRRTALRLEADDVIIRLKTTHPRYASLQSVEPLSLTEVQQFLDERTTLVSYSLLEPVVAFVVTRQSIDAVELPITPKQLEELVPKAFGPEAFASLQEVPTEALKELHAALVASVAPYLKTPRVGLIPQGVLHYVPFAALTDGKQYFGDAHTLFTLPSASTLRFLPKQRSGKGPVLAMAQARPPGLGKLKAANAEALSIAQLYGTRPLLGPAATEAAFKKAAPRASIIHLAAHGLLDASSPLFSRLALLPGEEEDGLLTVEEIYDLDLPVSRLVVLSACESHKGAHSQGDDVVGLTSAFLYAQAPTVVSSLWQVSDEASRVLMTEFHTQLKQGKPKAEALREAQACTRARFPHPYYWAAFVLTGDPG